MRGRWRLKPLTTQSATGVSWEGVALTPGKSQGGKGGEPNTGSKDRYKRRRVEGAKGKESTGQEGQRGVENNEGNMNGAESNSLENPRNRQQTCGSLFLRISRVEDTQLINGLV